MEDSELIRNVWEAYPDLGNYVYLGLVPGSHSVLFEIPNKKLNWIWYVNRSEPNNQVSNPSFVQSSKLVFTGIEH